MQKKVGNTLYVFDTTPFTITEDTNVEVIYVQNECLKGYLELNTELANKIHGFNQFVMTVKPAPWSDGGATEQPQNYHLLTVPGYDEGAKPLYVDRYDINTLPGESPNLWFHNVNTYQRNAGMIDANVTDKIYCNAGVEVFIMRGPDEFESITGFSVIDTTNFGQRYGVIMGDSDMTVEYSYTLKPTYHVNFSADSNASADIEIYPQERYAGGTVWIRFLNNQSSSTITVTSTDVELTYDQPNDEYSFTMPGHDVTIKAVYATEQPQNYHLLTVSDVGELYVRNYDTKLPPGGVDNHWFTSFNRHQREAGMIDQNMNNTIYCNAGAMIYLAHDVDAIETITGLEIIDEQGYEKYGVIMGDSDMTVNFSYTLKPTYHVNFSADSNASADIQIDPVDAYAGKHVIIRFLNNQSSSTITLTSSDVELTYDQPNDEYSFTMPGHDVTIKAVHANA